MGLRNLVHRLVACIGLAAIISIWPALFGAGQMALAADRVVHAVLFYSPSCGHCEKVITEDLPPLLEQYGDQLNIIGVNIQTEGGQQLFSAAIERYNIPQEHWAVPCMIVGDTILYGAIEIPTQLPGIIEQGLASGGIPWPDIPGLAELLPEETQEPISQTASESIPETLSVTQKFSRDVVGNSLSVLVLLGMLASAGVLGYHFLANRPLVTRLPVWITPLLALIGLGVALYLSYVEITLNEAACGPIGDCNIVQQSPYARLFGVLPVGVLGAIGYVAILAAWLIGNYGPQAWKKTAKSSLWGMVWFGLLFSIYLTFLEPFVIGATCMWCLSSAIIITLLLWSTTPLRNPPPGIKRTRYAAR